MSEQPTAPATGLNISGTIMTDGTATVPAPAETAVTPQTTEPAATAKPDGDLDHWRSMAREQEKRAKANAAAAKRLQEIEDAAKTAEQRAADQALATQRELDEAKATGARYRAAIKHGLSEDALDLLGSGDEDVIEERAKRLGAFMGAATERDSLKAEVDRLTAENAALREGRPVPLTGRPVTALQAGATPAPQPNTADDSYPAHWLPAVAAARNDSG